MGASNALRAYRTYGAILTDRPLRVFVYMALVSKDRDSEPWCAIGHEQLSLQALGRKVPPAGEQPDERRVALRAVERTITSLADAGCIRTVRKATYGVRGMVPAKYRLYLDEPCRDNRPPASTRQQTTGDGRQPTRHSLTGDEKSTRHSVTGHPSLNDAPPVTQRRAKEEEEERRSDKTGVLQSTREVEGSPNGVALTEITDQVLAADSEVLTKKGLDRHQQLISEAAQALGPNAHMRAVVHAAAELARQAEP